MRSKEASIDRPAAVQSVGQRRCPLRGSCTPGPSAKCQVQSGGLGICALLMLFDCASAIVRLRRRSTSLEETVEESTRQFKSSRPSSDLPGSRWASDTVGMHPHRAFTERFISLNLSTNCTLYAHIVWRLKTPTKTAPSCRADSPHALPPIPLMISHRSPSLILSGQV